MCGGGEERDRKRQRKGGRREKMRAITPRVIRFHTAGDVKSPLAQLRHVVPWPLRLLRKAEAQRTDRQAGRQASSTSPGGELQLGLHILGLSLGMPREPDGHSLKVTLALPLTHTHFRHNIYTQHYAHLCFCKHKHICLRIQAKGKSCKVWSRLHIG